jgi:glycosyltransferase involved in cell wall biosynthesis
MACGCSIVASDTDPVKEAIVDQQTGLLVDFFSPSDVAQKTIRILEDASLRKVLGKNARVFAKERYDLHRVCLPQMLEVISSAVKLY